MIGPLGRLGAAATLWQHRPQMNQRPGTLDICYKAIFEIHINGDVLLESDFLLSQIPRAVPMEITTHIQMDRIFLLSLIACPSHTKCVPTY